MPIFLLTAAASGFDAQPRMGDPLPDLTVDQLDAFLLGAIGYDRTFDDPAEGAGPVFNRSQCSSCHTVPAMGGSSHFRVTIAGILDGDEFDPLTDFGGPLFHQTGLPVECAENVPPQANHIVRRVSNGMFGYGLVEAISDADLLAFADPDDLDGDGISGRAHMVELLEDPGTFRVGRFGWKAQVATMLHFSAGATLFELGITNRLLPEDNDPNGIFPPNLGDPDFCDQAPDPEDSVAWGDGVSKEYIDIITDFQRYLAGPPQTPKSGMTGETIFNDVGCNQCHVTTFVTADDPILEDAIRNKTIHPYSDFLIHDMGDWADFIPTGDAGLREMRTNPLWGVRGRQNFWHSGDLHSTPDDPLSFRQAMITSIQRHNAPGSEAQGSAQAFMSLSPVDRGAVVAFLDSLGRIEFDADDNGSINIADFQDFLACSMIEEVITPDDPCAIHDVDQDGDVDVDDLDVMITVYEGLLDDCNGNGVVDLIDLVNGTSTDADGDGFPDECQIIIEEAPIIEFTLNAGTVLAGDLMSLEQSDDDRLEYEPQVNFNGNLWSSILSITALSPVSPLLRLDLTLEANVAPPGIDLVVSLRNVASSSWDEIGDFEQTETDAVIKITDVANPNDYLSGSDQIRIRLRSTVPIAIFPDSYVQSVDHVLFEVSGGGAAAAHGPGCSHPYDLTGDRAVDGEDVMAMLELWGTSPKRSADLNRDGIVDIHDLFDLLEAWGACPE